MIHVDFKLIMQGNCLTGLTNSPDLRKERMFLFDNSEGLVDKQNKYKQECEDSSDSRRHHILTPM